MSICTEHNFPLIQYKAGASHYDWGLEHGKQFKAGIHELYQIRKELMLARNPSLRKHLSSLAQEQWEKTKEFSPEISQELQGIADGSELDIEAITILNNYTDFRDIQLPEEGCSTIHVQRGQLALSGQTWDMHRSAKNYLCIIHVPEHDNSPEILVLSLVGCTGLMAMSADGRVIGVNNINTENAKAGIIWPALVRQTLAGKNLSEMASILKNAPVTSGHNYIISTHEGGQHWEVTPTASECVGEVQEGSHAESFHTNHCLGESITPLEMKTSLNSTTHQRFELLTRKAPKVKNFEHLYSLLTDHEEYPKSICSHFESGAQDPSFTCGGGIIEISQSIQAKFWRGCPHAGEDYKDYDFLSDGKKWTLKNR